MENPCLILIVDDDPRGRAALESALVTEGYRAEQAADGREAIECARRLQPDVVLLDVMMPEMDGFDVCRALRADPRTAEVPIILVTALDDRDALLQGIDAGADELIVKPFNRLELRTRLRTLTRINRYRQLVNERKTLEATTSGIVSVLTDILSLADRESFGRAQRVRDRAMALAAALGLGRPWPIEIGALLCRVGNMTVPESVQAKAAARTPLSPAEAGLLRRVPEIGGKVLSHLPQFAEIAALIRWHDARYDGSDEPEAPRGDALPIGARILKVAHDSIGLEQHLPPEDAWTELSTRSGWYDPAVLAALERLRRQESRPGTARFEVRAARRGSLQCGWRLHQDLLAADGTLLLGAGHELSPVALESIANFAAIAELKEPIMVEVPIAEPEAIPPAPAEPAAARPPPRVAELLST